MSDPKPPHVMRFEDRMTQADALMWHLESDPVLRSTILSTWILDRMPDLARFKAKAERATQIIPRLRQHVVADPLGIAPPKWEADPHFDLRFHLRRTALPGQGSIRDLLDLAEPIAMQAFDKDRPLWELHLIEGLEGGRCAVIMKRHHAISDGVGLVKMTECLVERGPDNEVGAAPLPAPATKNAASKSEPSAWDSVTDALTDRIRAGADNWRRFGAAVARDAVAKLSHPIDTANQVGDTLASAGRVLAPASEPLSPIMRERSTMVRFDYLSIPLDDLKRAGNAVGGTINDAFVASVAGGLARYHNAMSAPVESLRMLMPVNIRGGANPRDLTTEAAKKADVVGNQFAPARFEVPVAIESPAERMRAIGKLCREQRDEPAMPWIEEITNVLGALPSSLTNSLFGAMQKTTDFTTSNVPGPRRTTWMSGAKIVGFMPFGPLAGASINVTAFSYDGVMNVGINMDPAAVSQPKLLVECMKGGFEEVLAVVG
jgi:diacylglycerol O-acyltransferase